MSEEYYKSRVDTFLPHMDIRPKDSKPFGYTQNDAEKIRQQIIAAGRIVEHIRNFKYSSNA